MRHTRKRFTVSRERTDIRQRRNLKTIEGVSRFRQSKLGLQARHAAIMEQRQQQGSRCHLCENWLGLDDCVLLTDEFERGSVPPVVHKKCRRNYEKGHAGNPVGGTGRDGNMSAAD